MRRGDSSRAARLVFTPGALPTSDGAERAREIGDLHRGGILPATAELLIDAEQDRALRAVVVGLLREAG